MKCVNCKKEILDDSIYCEYCGANLVKLSNLKKKQIVYTVLGIICVTSLAIVCFLPGVECEGKVTPLESTWGLLVKLPKENFYGSLVALVWLGILAIYLIGPFFRWIGDESMPHSWTEQEENKDMLLVIAFWGLGLLIHTAFFSIYPHAIVFDKAPRTSLNLPTGNNNHHTPLKRIFKDSVSKVREEHAEYFLQKIKRLNHSANTPNNESEKILFSILGIRVKWVSKDISYHIEYGFWIMLSIIIIQSIIAIRLKRTKAQIDTIVKQ